jgi:hypothetical protein
VTERQRRPRGKRAELNEFEKQRLRAGRLPGRGAKKEKVVSLNKVMVIGHLGQDPEIRYTPAGLPVANFTVATNEVFVDKEGKRQERTESTDRRHGKDRTDPATST